MTAALAFYNSILRDGIVLSAFSAMLRSIRNNRYRDIYIVWGLHFTTLPRPANKSDDTVIAGLVANYALWSRKLTTTKDEEVKRNTYRIVRFLSYELRRRIPPERLNQIPDIDIVDADEMERSRSTTAVAEVQELILRKESQARRIGDDSAFQ